MKTLSQRSVHFLFIWHRSEEADAWTSYADIETGLLPRPGISGQEQVELHRHAASQECEFAQGRVTIMVDQQWLTSAFM